MYTPRELAHIMNVIKTLKARTIWISPQKAHPIRYKW